MTYIRDNNENLEWYLEAVVKELQPLIESNFWGNIVFRMNLKNGSIADMNCIKERCIKRIVKH